MYILALALQVPGTKTSRYSAALTKGVLTMTSRSKCLAVLTTVREQLDRHRINWDADGDGSSEFNAVHGIILDFIDAPDCSDSWDELALLLRDAMIAVTALRGENRAAFPRYTGSPDCVAFVSMTSQEQEQDMASVAR